MAELRFTKDGVPIYDGSPELFVAFQRAALIYAETIEWKKRSLVGPRLQAALEGSAKMVVEHKSPGWISHPNGASQLLECLKQQVRAPTLAEAGRTMSRFFYGIKRRRGEGMAAWIVRHDEALLEAKRTLAEAIQEYGPGPKRSSLSRTPSWKTSSRQPRQSRGSSEHEHEEQDEEAGEGAPTDEAEELDEGAASENVAEVEEGREWSDHWWSAPWHSWGWESTYSDRGHRGSGYEPSGRSWASWDASEAASAQAERFLPDFVIAWLLLQRSGLDASEKSVIVATLKNNFSITKVKEALKLTWPDDDLKRRDSSRSNSAMFTMEEEALFVDDEDFETPAAPEWEDPEEGYAYAALEDEAQEAMVAVGEARQTLKEAREKQAQMRRNRNFFPGRISGGSNTGGSRPPIKCFRCGGNHMRKDCPQNSRPSQPEQKVHFVFSATDLEATAEPEDGSGASEKEASLLALHKVVQSGNAIIDGGATSSLGSEEAVAQIANLNWKATGDDRIKIVPEEQPSFRFGNNAQHQCMSTALVKLPSRHVDSTMRVHVHDIPGQPVLLSVKSLRALGAVIDFSNDQAVFRSLDPAAVVTLQTTESGHQLFPLTRDVLEGATPLRRPFKSFEHHDQHAHTEPRSE